MIRTGVQNDRITRRYAAFDTASAVASIGPPNPLPVINPITPPPDPTVPSVPPIVPVFHILTIEGKAVFVPVAGGDRPEVLSVTLD